MGIMVQLVPSPRPCSLSLSSLTGRNFPDEPALVHRHRPKSGKFPRRTGHTRAGGGSQVLVAWLLPPAASASRAAASPVPV